MKSSPQKVVKQSSAQSTCVTCGDFHDKLLPLNEINNWRTIWNAARVRDNERVLALGSADELPENLMYGSECRKVFVRKRTLEKIKKVTMQEKINSSESQVPADKEADLPHSPKLSKQQSEDKQEKAQNDNVSLLGENKVARHEKVVKHSISNKLEPQVSADEADLPHSPKLSKQHSEDKQEKAQNESVSLLGKNKVASRKKVVKHSNRNKLESQVSVDEEADLPHSPKLSKQHSEGKKEKAQNENVSLHGKDKVARHKKGVKHSNRNKLVTSRNKFIRQRGRGRSVKSHGRLVSQRRYMKWDTSVLKNFHTWNRVINTAYDIDILKFTCNEQVANETHCSCYRKYIQADNRKGKSRTKGIEQREDMDLDGCVDYDSVEAKAYSALFEHIREKSFSQSHSEVLTLSDLIDLLCSKMIAEGVKGVRDSTKKITRRKIEAEFGKSLLFVKTESGIVYLMKSTVSQKDPDKELHDTQHELRQIEKKSAHC